jgi:hypothetical protein
MTKPQTWTFAYDGEQGRVEFSERACYVTWGGMGFHISAANIPLWNAIWAAQPRG